MKSKLLILTAIVAAASSAAIADGSRKATPVLSGTHAIGGSFYCLSGDPNLAQITGALVFDSAAGTVSISGYRADGDPETLTQFSQPAVAYSNTKTTLTINGTVHRANYGALKKGIVTYVSFLAVAPNQEGHACGDQYWAARE